MFSKFGANFRSGLAILSAVSFSFAPVRAAENSSAVKDMISDSLNQSLNISDKALSDFPELSNLFKVISQQQTDQKGLSPEDSQMCQGLIRIIACGELEKSDLSEKRKDQMLKMSAEEFDAYCLKHGILIRYAVLNAADDKKVYFGEISICRVSKDKSLSGLCKQTYQSQIKKFAEHNLRYAEFAVPEVYSIGEIIISSGTELAGTIVKLGPKSSAILMDPAIIKNLTGTWLDGQEKAYIRTVLANELAHIRNDLLFPGKKDTQESDISVLGKKIRAIYQEYNEAVSDFASLIEEPNNPSFDGFYLCQALLDRGPTYRLSDKIHSEIAKKVFQDKLAPLINLADEYNKTNKAEVFDKLFNGCFELVKNNPEYRLQLITTYDQVIKGGFK